MSEKKIDLIAQMLAKAEQTTPEEAEALMAAAEKMMIKYGVDQAIIDERRAKKGEASEKIIQKSIQFTGAYRGELLHLSAQVAVGLGTIRPLQSTWGGKVFTAYLVGFESDVAQAELLINSLQVQAAVAVREWWKTNKGSYAHLSSYDQEKARRSFVHGFGSGAGKRIQDSRRAIFEEVSKGTELVLVSRTAKVNEYFDGISKSKGRARTATGRDGAASKGFEAGQKANTGERGLSQGRGISA